MIQPKISIITPSFNQAQYLEQTILSIINQNYSNLEYIIIDGGSTDGSVEIIKKYEKHLTYWVSEKDKGQSEAINKGLKKTTGEIITWINSDDLLVHNSLKKIEELFYQNLTIDFIHGKTILFGDNQKEIINGANETDIKFRALAGMPYSQPSCFFRKKVLDEQGYLDTNLHYAMDYDLFVRIALNYDMLKTENIFSKYRLHEKSKSISENNKFANEWAIVFSKLLRSFDFAGEIIKEMKKLNLYNENIDSYNVSKPFTTDDLKKSFLYFLEYQIHSYYNNRDLDRAKELAFFVKNYDFDFHKQHQLEYIYIKSSLLNKSIINFFRIFTR